MRRLVRVAPNSVFGLAGLTFVTENPEQRCRQWSDGLRSGSPVASIGDSGFAHGLHRYQWLTPSDFQRQYRGKRRGWPNGASVS